MKRTSCSYDVEELKSYVKKRKTTEKDDGPVFSDKSKKMMQMMGHTEGKGLGKKEQGIVEPIAASDQRGRSGLGAKKGKIEENEDQWNFELEKPFQCERKTWFEFKGERPFISDDCIKLGVKKLSLERETNFCQEDILESILKGKSFFDEMDRKVLQKGVAEANMYEKIGKSFFMNRAAVKMANMDAKFKHMFTHPTFLDNSSLVAEDELLTFADICAGPGGFSEYVLWKTKGIAKGYGFTIKGSNDFKLQDFKAGPSEMFEPHYGVGGSNGDGNIYCVDNQESFKTFILDKTKGRGVHFVMADGGFSVDGQENMQEILSHRLYLCQAIVALNILMQGGHYVCKLFDSFTEFSCGLIFLLATCFRKICIFKPVTSRPANSERYLVCEGMRGDVMEVVAFLKRVNAVIQSLDNVDCKDKAVCQLVPLEMMQENEAFMNYMVDSNNYLGHLQSIALLKVKTFIQNNMLVEKRGIEVSNKCLLMWGLNVVKREEFCSSFSPEKLFETLSMKMGKIHRKRMRMEKKCLLDEMKSKRDYVACVVDSQGPYSLLSGGKDKAWIFEHDEWRDCKEVQTNLPHGTLLKVDLVVERRGRTKIFRFEAIDLLCWGGQSYTMYSFQGRRQQLELLLNASNKEPMPNYHIKMKKCLPLDDLEKEVFDKIVMARLPNEGPCLKHLLPLGAGLMNVRGIIFFKVNNDPWCAHYSSSSNSLYYFNFQTGESTYKRPLEADCTYSQTSMLEWTFGPGTLADDPGAANEALVTKDYFLKYLSSFK